MKRQKEDKFYIYKDSFLRTLGVDNYRSHFPEPMQQNNRTDEVLHGVTLSMIMDTLIEVYGFEDLSQLIRINCFKSHPSKESSLKFLRKTEWARLQVQGLYVRTMLERR